MASPATDNRPLLLIVDDDQALCETFADLLDREGYNVQWTTDAHGVTDLVEQADFAAVLTDVQMQGMTGIELCRQLHQRRPNLPVVVMTAFGSMETAVEALRAGAYDFISKPVDHDALKHSLRRAVREQSLQREVARLTDELDRARGLGEMIGESPAIKKVYSMVRRVADTDASVLIIGESGTGKELVAKALHDHSPRHSGRFVVVNCAAMPAPLLESELFGHVKGAFTDAKSAKTGLLVEASGGTLFLDEIGEMPLEMQPKLLRALQEKKVRPVGGTSEISYDARILAATNRDLEEEVEKGRFREDLFYRINVVRIDVPPLRARGADILLLAQAFLEKAARASSKNVEGIRPDAAQKIRDYEWPGNVRELQNCMERAVALSRGGEITAEDLPEKIRAFHADHITISTNDPADLLSMEEVEKRYIQRVLRAVGGNKTQAAKILGFDRRTLYRKLERYGED